jgi:hypothetical protein
VTLNQNQQRLLSLESKPPGHGPVHGASRSCANFLLRTLRGEGMTSMQTSAQRFPPPPPYRREHQSTTGHTS